MKHKVFPIFVLSLLALGACSLAPVTLSSNGSSSVKDESSPSSSVSSSQSESPVSSMESPSEESSSSIEIPSSSESSSSSEESSSSESLSSSEEISSSSEPVSSSTIEEPSSSSEPSSESSSSSSSESSSEPESSLAYITFGSESHSSGTAFNGSGISTSGVTVQSSTSNKAYSNGEGYALKMGSSSSGGSVTFKIDPLHITSIDVVAYQFKSTEATTVTATTSAYSDSSAQNVYNPTYDASTYYTFDGLDNGSGTKSSSITISSSARIFVAEIRIHVGGGSGSVSEPTESEKDWKYKDLTSSNSDSISSSYKDGNYDKVSIGNIDYKGYRTYGLSSSGGVVKLIAGKKSTVASTPEDPLPGSFANADPIYGIRKIVLDYSSTSTAKIYFGKNNIYSEEASISSGTKKSEFSVKAKDACFFKIESGSADLSINSIRIYYKGDTIATSMSYLSSGEGKYRINPTVYSGTPSNLATIDMPIAGSSSSNGFVASSKKTYTYYTYDYVSSHTGEASKAAYTDPIDVANYFIAFGTYPANYVSKSDYSAAKSIFGDKTRCVSNYSRTDGYCKAIPYRSGNGGVPHYYECDIALGSYSSSNRGVGRLIVFKEGFNENGYSTAPVAVFTDDHYSTFIEYYNNGSWSHRFNSYYDNNVGLCMATSYEYGSPLTVSSK